MTKREIKEPSCAYRGKRFACLFLLSFLGSLCCGQTPQKNSVLDALVDRDTAVSFFWFGDIESHFREPMDFYVVGENDPRLHKIKVESFSSFDDGWLTFLTAAEMRGIIARLKMLPQTWNVTSRREVFRSFGQRDNSDLMDVTVVSKTGTAKTYIRIARMCDELASLDPSMPTARILWQYRLLRVDNGCVVPDFNGSVVPKG